MSWFQFLAGGALSAFVAWLANDDKSGTVGAGGGLIATWPEDALGRSAAVLEAIRDKRGQYAYSTVTSSAGKWKAEIPVFADGLMVEGIRVNADMRTAQLVADELGGAVLLTPKLSDLIYAQADRRIAPQPQAWYPYDKKTGTGDGTMALTRRMVDYSRILDKRLPKSGQLVDNAGKDWVLSSGLWQAGTSPARVPWSQTAANYGWHKAGGGVIQPLGFAHGLTHADYSQLLRFAGPTSLVSDNGGVTWDSVPTAELYSDPERYLLVSYERLPAARHPGVPPVSVSV